MTATSQEWVREAEAAVEAEEETLRSARATLEDLEHIVRRCHDAFLDSDRIKVCQLAFRNAHAKDLFHAANMQLTHV